MSVIFLNRPIGYLIDSRIGTECPINSFWACLSLNSLPCRTMACVYSFFFLSEFAFFSFLFSPSPYFSFEMKSQGMRAGGTTKLATPTPDTHRLLSQTHAPMRHKTKKRKKEEKEEEKKERRVEESSRKPNKLSWFRPLGATAGWLYLLPCRCL